MLDILASVIRQEKEIGRLIQSENEKLKICFAKDTAIFVEIPKNPVKTYYN